MDRCYYLTVAEFNLLSLYDLERFVQAVPRDYPSIWYDYVIFYDKIDDLARVVYSRKYKGSKYDELIALVNRLQEVLEINPDL